MNTTEAVAVDTLLRHLLGTPGDTGDLPSDKDARAAAARLADRANAALSAGLTSVDVHNDWPETGEPRTRKEHRQ